MADIKAKYGRNAVQLEFDGDGSFVKDLDFVASVAGRLRMRRFETVSPSLHKIFVRLVGGEVNDA